MCTVNADPCASSRRWYRDTHPSLGRRVPLRPLPRRTSVAGGLCGHASENDRDGARARSAAGTQEGQVLFGIEIIENGACHAQCRHPGRHLRYRRHLLLQSPDVRRSAPHRGQRPRSSRGLGAFAPPARGRGPRAQPRRARSCSPARRSKFEQLPACLIQLRPPAYVTRGLDPGLTRGSILSARTFLRRRWIARVHRHEPDLSAGDCWEADGGIIAQGRDRFQDLPLPLREERGARSVNETSTMAAHRGGDA